MRSVVALWLVLLLAVSCAPLSLVGERPSPELSGLEQDIRARLEKRNQAIKVFEAEADIVLGRSGADYRGRVLILGQGSGSIRLDCLGPFDQTILSCVVDGERFALISSLAMKYYEGSLASPVVSSLIPPGIKVQDLYRWFLGGYDLQDRHLISCSRDIASPSLWIMEVVNERSGLREEVWLESTTGLIKKLVLKEAGGNVILTGEMEGLVENGDLSYPGSVGFSLPSCDFHLKMVYTRVGFLSSVPAGTFSLHCPPGFKRKIFN